MTKNNKTPQKVPLSFYISQAQAKKLDKICKINHRTRSGQIEKWITEAEMK